MPGGALDPARQIRRSPANKPYIDWTNPLTRELVFCWFYPYGDLTGFSRLSASTAFTPKDTPYGKSGNDAAGSSYESWTIGKVSNTSPTTALVSGSLRYLSSATYRYLSVASSNDDAAATLYCQAASTSLRFTVGGTPFISSSTTSVPSSTAPGSPITVIGTWTGGGASTSGTISLYNNGVFSSTTGTVGVRGATSIEVGRYNSAFNQNSNSALKIAAIWNRSISQQEALALTRDPFAFIRSR